MKFLTLYLAITTIGLCIAEEFPEVPDFNDLTIIKNRCEKKGSPESFEKIKQAKADVVPCVKNIINVDTIKTEVEEAKKTGSMDDVFGKYCRKRTDIKQCVEKVIEATKPCLEDNEKEALNITINIIKELGEFACYRDGDRIAMFVAEGGVECLKSHVEGIKNCFNATFKINPENISFNSVPNLSITKEKCNDITTVQNCVVEELEKCTDSTPANIVDALFKFVKKSACKNIQRRSLTKREIYNSYQQRLGEIIIKKMQNYCDENGPANAWSDLKATFDQSKECSKKYRQFNEIKTECLPTVSEKMKSCLPESLKYYPDLMLELSESLNHFIDVYKKKIKLNDPENVEYFNCLNQLKTSNELKQCAEDNITSDLVTKEQICRNLNAAIRCISNTVKKVCIRDIKIDSIITDLSSTLTKPCINV